MKKWAVLLLSLCLLFVFSAATGESADPAEEAAPASVSCAYGPFSFTCPAGWESMEMGDSLMVINADASAFLTVFAREYKEKDGINLSEETDRKKVFDTLMAGFGCEESEDIGTDRRALGKLEDLDSVFYLAARENDVLIMIYSVLKGDAPEAEVIQPFVDSITHS